MQQYKVQSRCYFKCKSCSSTRYSHVVISNVNRAAVQGTVTLFQMQIVQQHKVQSRYFRETVNNITPPFFSSVNANSMFCHVTVCRLSSTSRHFEGWSCLVESAWRNCLILKLTAVFQSTRRHVSVIRLLSVPSTFYAYNHHQPCWNTSSGFLPLFPSEPLSSFKNRSSVTFLLLLL